MLKMAQIQYIKHLYETEDKSLREISRITSHSFNTVKKYAYQDNWSPDNLPNIDPQNYPTLGPFIPIIDEWLDNDRWNCQESCSLKNTQNSLSIIVQFADCNRCNCSSHIFGILSSSP